MLHVYWQISIFVIVFPIELLLWFQVDHEYFEHRRRVTTQKTRITVLNGTFTKCSHLKKGDYPLKSEVLLYKYFQYVLKFVSSYSGGGSFGAW